MTFPPTAALKCPFFMFLGVEKQLWWTQWLKEHIADLITSIDSGS